MIVCIAEKPSVARDIAEVLGAHTRKEGYIEGNGYQVTWTFGHLCTLKEPHEYTPNRNHRACIIHQNHWNPQKCNIYR